MAHDTCCKIDCTAKATKWLQISLDPSDFTLSCDAHVGDLTPDGTVWSPAAGVGVFDLTADGSQGALANAA